MPSDLLLTVEPPVRVAIWGAGRHAELRLLPALSRCASVAIAGLATRDAGRGTALATRYGCVFWARPEDMLRAEEVDVVLVATPVGCHAVQCRAVLDASKHLWCEKSLTVSARESEELVAEARRRDLVLAETFMFLYHPLFQKLVTALAEVGAIVSLTSRFFMPSFAFGSGGLLEVGCYPLQAAIALLGDDFEVRQARLVRSLDFAVDTSGHAILEARSGVTAILEWGFGAAYRNDLTLCGVAASVDADRVFSGRVDYKPSLVIRDAHGSVRNEPVMPTDSFPEMFSALASASHDKVLRGQLYTRALVQARLLEKIRSAAS